MIYFIEHDDAGNIVHACADPAITMVPLINRVTFNDASGNPLKDANGTDLSPYGSKLAEPIGVDEATYTMLVAKGLDKYACDTATNNQVVARAIAV